MRRKLWRWLVGGIVLAGCALAQSAASVELQTAIRTEVVDGDLAGAIRMYEKIANATDRQVAAQALLRMARCFEARGDTASAIRTYKRLVGSFNEQKEAQEARRRLKLLEIAATSGWYNGDWQSGIPGPSNWYRSASHFCRVYDDFVVPEGGWTVESVFSNNHMADIQDNRASWEIRSGMAAGDAGTVVGAGVSNATQTANPNSGPFRGTLVGYRIQVDGLRMELRPGRYWLSVAPVGSGEIYIDTTLGRNAIGVPAGNNGMAYRLCSIAQDPTPTEIVTSGQMGLGRDFSQGVKVSNRSK